MDSALTYLSCLSYNIRRMKKKDFKKPKFSLDRSRRGDLVSQVAAGLRMAIKTGFYQAGEILPPVRDLAEILEVGKSVAEQAIATIRDEGLISPRPSIGSVVCPSDRPLWKGQVLIIVPGGDSIRYEMMIAGAVRDALTDAGYLPLMASVRDKTDGNPDFSFLESQIHQQIDLVVQIVGTKAVLSWLEAKGIPFVSMSRFTTKSTACAGRVLRRWDLATANFVAHCLEKSVKEVLLVSLQKGALGTVNALECSGIAAKEWCIERSPGVPGVKNVSDNALKAFAERFRNEGRGWLPDVILFADDNLTTGALQAMLAEGIRVPEDVAVVTWANRWDGPVYSKPFTRMEMDAVADGKRLAQGVLEYLSKGTFPKGIIFGPEYIFGETF